MAVFTLACLAAFYAGALAVRTLGRSAGRFAVRMQGRWCRGMLRILGGRLAVAGRPPEGAHLLVSNHLGYVDIAVLGSCLDATFVARADLSGWPVFGFLSRAVGTVFVDRDRRRDATRAVAAMRSALADGRAVVLFPEGTSSDGRDVLPFKSALLETAASGDLPVAAAALAYRTPAGCPPAATSVAWWDETTLPTHLFRLLTLPGFEARVAFGDDIVRHEDRKVLAEALWQKVRVLHRSLAAA